MNMQEIRQAAFEDEMQKISGLKTEIAGTVGGSLLLGLSLPALGIGAIIGPRSEAEMSEQNSKTVSNLIPFVGPYRLGRRLATKGFENRIELLNNEMKESEE